MTEHGVYHTILGPLHMAETIPAEHKECRLVQERGLYWLTVPYPAQSDIETPLRLRMPDGLAELHGKYLVDVRFASGHDVVLAALGSNTEYGVYRRQHGEQAARTPFGQAISIQA